MKPTLLIHMLNIAVQTLKDKEQRIRDLHSKTLTDEESDEVISLIA